jgi:hypothetical protein
MKEKLMKKNEPEMLDEYDFSKGIRGKYVQRYAEGSNIVIIDPDVAEVFPDSESVNEALRLLIKIAKQPKKVSVV